MALYRENGTRVTRAALATEAVGNPQLRLTESLIHKESFDMRDQPDGGVERVGPQSGSVYTTSVIDSWFKSADVQNVSPATGGTAGGDVVTITGDDLDGVTAVSFGGTPGTSLNVVDHKQLTVTTPAGAAGAVDITLADDNGTTTVTDGFTYA